MVELRSFGEADYDALIGWFPTESALRDFAGPDVRRMVLDPQA